MIILGGTSDIIRVTPSAATAVHVQASWVLNAATITPGRTNTILAAASVATVVAAPTGTDQRNVKHLSLVAVGGANTVTIEHYDGTTAVQLYKAALATGESVIYTDAAGWQTLDATGSLKAAPRTGLLLKTTVLTAGVSFTTTATTASIFIRMCGGGGGGAGCTSVASAAASGGGGGGGAYAEKTFAVSPSTAYTYAIGAAGTGASGAAGNAGTASTFAVGATTVTAPGGSGAPVATAATTLTARAGGAGRTVATNGDLNRGGYPGGNGYILIVTGAIGCSGEGGSGCFGSGGVGISAAGNGNPGLGYGAGGGGAHTAAAAVRTGGNGTAGVIVVDEYS